MDAYDLALPRGLLLKRIILDSATGPLEWWRVVTPTGRVIGSGFDRAEAVQDARRELGRAETVGG